MSIGASATKVEFDATTAQLARQVFSVFDSIGKLQATFTATPDANLVALGYTQAEVNILKSAFTDLDLLRTVFQGTATQAVTKDFRLFAKQLLGVGLY